MAPFYSTPTDSYSNTVHIVGHIELIYLAINQYIVNTVICPTKTRYMSDKSQLSRRGQNFVHVDKILSTWTEFCPPGQNFVHVDRILSTWTNIIRVQYPSVWNADVKTAKLFCSGRRRIRTIRVPYYNY